MDFMTYQLEKGKKKGRKHWQGVVRFVDNVSLDYAKSLFGFGFFITKCLCLKKAVRYVRKSQRLEPFVTYGKL